MIRSRHIAVLACVVAELGSAACVTVQGAATDAGALSEDAQSDASSDVAPSALDAGASDATTCAFKHPNVPAGVLGWPQRVPEGGLRPRNDCDSQYVEYLVRCDFGDPTINSATCAQRRSEPWWQPCADCLYGQEGLTTLDGFDFPTPFALHAGAARLNIAGCIGFATNDWSLTGCEGDWYGDERCRSYACEECVGKGPAAFANCWARASEPGGPCPPHIKAECALQADDAGCGAGGSFISAAKVFARAFCSHDGG